MPSCSIADRNSTALGKVTGHDQFRFAAQRMKSQPTKPQINPTNVTKTMTVFSRASIKAINLRYISGEIKFWLCAFSARVINDCLSSQSRNHALIKILKRYTKVVAHFYKIHC
jgi:hypothetical protein